MKQHPRVHIWRLSFALMALLIAFLIDVFIGTAVAQYAAGFILVAVLFIVLSVA